MNINILSKEKPYNQKKIVGNMSQITTSGTKTFIFEMRVNSRDIETMDAIRDYFSSMRKTLEEIGFSIHSKKQ